MKFFIGCFLIVLAIFLFRSINIVFFFQLIEKNKKKLKISLKKLKNTMNIREGFPSKFQLDFLFQKITLNFGDPFARLSLIATLSTEKKSLLKFPVAKKETVFNEAFSFTPTLFECSVNKFNDCIVNIEVFLLKKENQKRLVGDFSLNLAEYAPKANKRLYEENLTVDLNNSSHYNGKLSFNLKISYQIKKQARSLSHTALSTPQNKEVLPSFRVESPKKNAPKNQFFAANRLSDHSEQQEKEGNYETKSQRLSPNPRVSIMELENCPEFDTFNQIHLPKESYEKIERGVQTEDDRLEKNEENKRKIEEIIVKENNINNLEEDFRRKVEELEKALTEQENIRKSFEEALREKEEKIIKISKNLSESQNNEKQLLEKMGILEGTLQGEQDSNKEKIANLTEEKDKIQRILDSEKHEFLKKYNILSEEIDKQMKKEANSQKTIRNLERELEEIKGSMTRFQAKLEEEHMGKVMFEKDMEAVKIEKKTLELYNESLKKQMENKEKKLHEIEENNSKLQEDYVKIKQKMGDVINLVFEKGGAELMEHLELLLELGGGET